MSVQLFQSITTYQNEAERGESTPLGCVAFTTFWCLLKLTNRLHYGLKKKQKTMRVKPQEVLYNFLFVVQSKCRGVWLLFGVGEDRIKRDDSLFITESAASRSTLIGMEEWHWENPNLSITHRGLWEMIGYSSEENRFYLRSNYLIKQSISWNATVDMFIIILWH